LSERGNLVFENKMWNVIIYTILFIFFCFLLSLWSIGFIRYGLRTNNGFALFSGIVGLLVGICAIILVIIGSRLAKFNIYENGVVLGMTLKEYIHYGRKCNKSEKFYHFEDILNLDTKHEWIIIKTKEKMDYN
jgi:hypothetical protein